MTLNPSVRSSFSKLDYTYNMDYTSSIAYTTSNIIVRALNVSNCTTSAGSNSIQSETSVLPLEKLLTQ